MARVKYAGPPVTPGRVVLYSLDAGPNKGKQRPAMVVTVEDDGWGPALGIRVFTAGKADLEETRYRMMISGATEKAAAAAKAKRDAGKADAAIEFLAEQLPKVGDAFVELFGDLTPYLWQIPWSPDGEPGTWNWPPRVG